MHDSEYAQLARLFVLGEKYQDSRFKNRIIDAMIAKHHDEDADGYGWSPHSVAIDILYRGTCDGSPVRKLMVHMWLDRGSSGWVTACKSLNHDFLRDLCALALNVRDCSSLTVRDWYHEKVAE